MYAYAVRRERTNAVATNQQADDAEDQRSDPEALAGAIGIVGLRIRRCLIGAPDSEEPAPQVAVTEGSIDDLVGWLRLDRKDHLRVRLKKLDSEKYVLQHPNPTSTT